MVEGGIAETNSMSVVDGRYDQNKKSIDRHKKGKKKKEKKGKKGKDMNKAERTKAIDTAASQVINFELTVRCEVLEYYYYNLISGSGALFLPLLL